MIPVQFDLFKSPEECELDAIRNSVKDIKISSDKVRRGMYARLNEVTKECNELKERLSILEKYICIGKNNES